MAALLDDLSLRELFDHCRDAIIVVEADSGQIIEANRAALELVDRSEEELSSLTFPELFENGERSMVRRLAARHPSQGRLESQTTRLRRTDGSTVTCEWSGWSSDQSFGRVFFAILRDRSAEVRVLEEIRLRNVAIASVNSGVAIADARLPDLPLIYVNEGFQKITGYSARECIGRNCRFLQGDDRDQPELEMLRDALRRGLPCEVRLRNYRKNGERFWNELHMSPVRDDDGQLTHFVGIQIDVTERVDSRRRLEESEKRYRTLAESIEDLIVRSSNTGTVQFLSPSLLKMLGWAPEAWIGKDFSCWVHPEDQTARAESIAACGPGNDSVTHTFRLRHISGSYVWVEATETLISPADSSPHFVSVIRDITLRRKAEEDIRNSLRTERELNQIKNSFIRMVSHEFRTPMTGISASTAFLRAYGDELSEEKRERHFNNIERSLHRMNRLLDDVLFVSRSETEQMQCGLEPIPLIDFCEHLLDETLSVHPGRSIELHTQIDRSEVFELDPHLLHHIFQNLLSNALKYSPSDKPVELEVIDDPASDLLHWRVTDRGIGIPEADQCTLFEPFRRAANVGTINGTGLGLFIAKRSAELHGGEIIFSSAEKVGSEFRLSLPRIVSAVSEHV